MVNGPEEGSAPLDAARSRNSAAIFRVRTGITVEFYDIPRRLSTASAQVLLWTFCLQKKIAG
jgi:hypothetical protein